ncbi:uncharacterized protein LAESUDRAFT_738894 [Laetiporus sulphureus 93-53]|uniref:Uncharacterized protein n=1 Tax=Laetiporus sulphureus 93-53 TaxID=1314785 RepID=A0A165C1F6_9APHY|nr:uncharacterized protein LAESUDRAFT_738894 [Laetiporus sulphureus 93-53]KZT02028.1 hypothetical protein LAESUDRAFT_738894 [Laetiporus sulphureus 93-53]
MTETLAQHPPATPEPQFTAPQPEEPTDYPRPAAPGEQAPHHEQHEEEVPRKEKRKGSGGDEHERRLQESLYRKAELNRPRKDMHTGKNRNNIGGGGRISQPAGRPLI